MHIISFYDDKSNSVVKNDIGELIFTNNNELITNEIIECVRMTSIEKKKHISKYILDKYDDTIIIEQEENNIMKCIISDLWLDKDKEAKLSIDMWKKFRVLTTEDLESINK